MDRCITLNSRYRLWLTFIVIFGFRLGRFTELTLIHSELDSVCGCF